LGAPRKAKGGLSKRISAEEVGKRLIRQVLLIFSKGEGVKGEQLVLELLSLSVSEGKSFFLIGTLSFFVCLNHFFSSSTSYDLNPLQSIFYIILNIGFS
jgi:hypothetical protein